MMDLKGKRVLVMGLGLHGGGLGVTRWLVRQGARVTVTDLKNADVLAPSLQALRGLDIRYVLGVHREEDFLTNDLIVRNPGVPRESRFLALAREHGIPVEMEMGLFFERLPRSGMQVIGITGTKGKTTTTLMVGAIMARMDPRTIVAGNLRVSALELLEHIDASTPVVLELSSWQLEGLTPHQYSPHIAAITNLYPDHMDRYRDMDDYAQAKAAIFRFQQPGDYLVLNLDSGPLTHMASRAFSQVVWTSAKRALKEGAYREGDALVWRWHGQREKVLNLADLLVAGEHNVENAIGAIATAAVAGATVEQIASELAAFRGVEHRQELVREIKGVRYVNDTTATAPAAAVAALQALAPTAGGIILIAGGADKALDFRQMAGVIVARVRHLVLLEGTATEKLARAVEEAGGKALLAGRYDDLGDAVERAGALAQPGDVVLLSPACASFGMFVNEFERGDRFKQIVSQLAG